MARRDFLKVAGGGVLASAAASAFAVGRPQARFDRVIVLGIDGMDPRLLDQYVREGRMPNCRKLIETGSFRTLGTSTPPQSPVAWSNFIAGTDPGGHGIFDFIARDPATLTPYLSTAHSEASPRSLRLGSLQIPLAKGKVENLRGGPTFWVDLERHGIDARIFKIPANFPPTQSGLRTLSGMGTPDVRGSYGVFSLFTTDSRHPALGGAEQADVAGGHVQRLVLDNGRADCQLRGPQNTFRNDARAALAPFRVDADMARGLVRIDIQGTQLVLKEREWSDWVAVRFPMLGRLAIVDGICRFFIARCREELSLYVSPVNLDPRHSSMPISTPASYARELAESLGLFYTQGMPEDTSALSAGALDDDAYRSQAMLVLEERLRAFEHELGQFRKGLFFFYFSSLDLNSHAFWRALDPRHPLYTARLAETHGDFLPFLYGKMDDVIGKAAGELDERSLLFAISDHGFTSFRRQFNLNSWLLDNGYTTLRDPDARLETELFAHVRWGETRAYGLGINSLYLNLQGREPDGVVAPGERRAVAEELIDRLSAIRDPENGRPVIAQVHRAEDIYHGPHAKEAPDLIVAYSPGYRASWETILGGYPREHLTDNTDPWSGDHCMDAKLLRGVCLCSHPLVASRPGLQDLAPTILRAFGVPVPAAMTGQNIV